jgi:hypothetical protein
MRILNKMDLKDSPFLSSISITTHSPFTEPYSSRSASSFSFSVSAVPESSPPGLGLLKEPSVGEFGSENTEEVTEACAFCLSFGELESNLRHKTYLPSSAERVMEVTWLTCSDPRTAARVSSENAFELGSYEELKEGTW